jgi:hypothetical protein
MAQRFSNTFRKSPVTVAALSRRADGCSQRFKSRQLSEVHGAECIEPVRDDDVPRAGQLSLL